MGDKNQCQMRSLIRGTIFGHARNKGEIFWTDAVRAKWLVDERIAEPVGALAAGPSETKPAEPAEKKFSSADPAGPSTAGAASSAPGTAEPSSASPEAPASRPRRPRRSKPGDAPETDGGGSLL